MFRWNEIQVVDYGFTESYELPINGASAVITGENGSGKTTFLDGLRLLLGDRHLTDDRSLHRYLRRGVGAGLLVAYVSNEPTGKGRRFFRQYNTNEVTLACAILRGSNKAAPTRRYFLGPGRVSVKELKEAGVQGSKWMGPEEYRRQMEIYGITDSVLNLLAIRQGEVQRVCASKPRQLYEYVLTNLANPGILKKYEENLEELGKIEQDLLSTQRALEIEELKLKARKHELEKLDEYETLTKTMEENTSLGTAARLQAKLRAREKHDADYQDRMGEVEAAEELMEDLRRSIDGLKKKAQPIRKELESWNEKLEQAEAHEKAMTKRRESLEEKYEQHQASRTELRRLPKIPMERAEREYEAAVAAQGPVAAEASRAEAEAEEIREEISTLEAGKTPFPPPVRQFYEALQRQGLKFRPIADLVADVDLQRLDAVENSLGNQRYSIVIHAKDRGRVVDVAKSHNFVASIYAGATEKTSMTAHVEFAEDVPPWLARAIADAELHADGTWSDSRGDWVHSDPARVLPSKGRQARIRKLKQNLREAEDRLVQVKRKLDGLRQELGDASERRQQAKDRARNEALIQELAPAAAEYKEAQKEERQAGKAADRLRSRYETEKEHLELLEDSVKDKEKNLEKQQGLRDRSKERANKAEDLAHESDEAIADLRKEMPTGLQSRAAKGELAEPDHYAGIVKDAKKGLEKFGTPPDPNIRGIVENLDKNVTALRSSVQKREAAQTAHVEAMTASRRQYIQAANLQLQEYKKRLETFEEFTGTGIRVEVPKFADSATDREIKEAELRLYVGFDNKTPELVGSKGAFSGGQRVVVGLMLIMALAEVGRQGFFIIDEPYESLSVTRVDQIARFIHDTPYQMIITVPTSFDPGHYQAGSVLVRFKEAPNENTPAPRPVFMVKRVAA